MYQIWQNSKTENFASISQEGLTHETLAKTSCHHPIMTLRILVMCWAYTSFRGKASRELPTKTSLVVNCLKSSYSLLHTKDYKYLETKDYKYLETLLIFTPIPIYAQEVWSLNPFPRENNQVASLTHIHHFTRMYLFFFSNKKLYMFLLLYLTDYLIRLAYWDFPIGL